MTLGPAWAHGLRLLAVIGIAVMPTATLLLHDARVIGDGHRMPAAVLLASAATTVLVLLAVWRGRDRFVRGRVQALVDAVARMTPGDVQVPGSLPYNGGDLGALARSIDHLAAAFERRQAQLATAERGRYTAEAAEMRFRQALASISDYKILMLDGNGVIVRWLHGARPITGYTSADVVGRPFGMLCPPDANGPGALGTLLARAAGHGHAEEERWLVRKDGARFWAHVSVTAVPEPGEAIDFAVVIRDDTERRAARVRLETLSRRLLEAQDAERRQVARELHDEVGQDMTVLRLSLEALRVDQAQIDPSVIEETLRLVDRLLDRVRNLSLDLHPSVLDDLGLAAAIQWHAERLSARAGFRVDLRCDPLRERWPAAIEIACFRVTQESLTNVARHARARVVRLALRGLGDCLDLRIRDDGIGFDVAAERARRAAGHSLGLLGMEERVQLAGGTFSLESWPGRGTLVHARFSRNGRAPGAG